jgi:flagellar M-ring protein FliF
MEPLTRIWNQARAYWGGLSGVVRGLIVTATVLAAVAVGVFAYLNQPGDGVPLFPERLPEEEVSAVTAVLESKGIKYTLADSHTIKVPKEQLAKARVLLAGEGLPARGGGKGYELFDQSNPLRTPTEIQVSMTRALQGELARSIMQIESVASARVIIARPDPTPFLRDQRPTTASVVLKLKPNATFSKGHAASVVQLVSKSVDGLKQENVTVVDSTGRLLSDPRAGEKDDLSQGLVDQRRELEHHLAQKAQEMLTAHLGPGRAVVQVSADLNYQKVKEQQTTYPKDGGVPRAERIINSKSAGGSRGGIAGAGSNVRQASATGGAGGSSTEETIQTDYDTSRMVREMEERMGAVTRLTVAALVDLTPPAAADGQPAPKTISVADAEAIIQNAVGFKTGRDSVKVVNERLGGPPQAVADPDEETANIQRMAAYVELARNISLAVAVAMAIGVLGLLGLLLMRKPKTTATAATATTAPAAGAPAATPEQRRQELLERFIETTRNDPGRTASVFGLLLGPGGG